MSSHETSDGMSSKAEASSAEKTAIEVPAVEDSSGSSAAQYLQHGSDENPRHRLWIGNMDYRITEYQIIKILQKFGEIKYFYYPYNKSFDNPQSSGYCFVEYATREEAEAAKKALEGRPLLDRPVRVSWSTGRTQSLLKQTVGVSDSDGSTSTTNPENTAAKITAIEAKLKLMQSGQEAVIGVPSRPRPKTPYDRPGYGRGGRGRGRGRRF